MILAVTGHRPAKLGGYGDLAIAKLVNVARAELLRLKPTRVITGMALGFDQAAAVAALGLEIPHTAAIPHEGQAARWSDKDADLWQDIKRRSDRVVTVTPGSCSIVAALMKRNRWMIDQADRVLACWDGMAEGGTFQAIAYAKRRGIPWENCYEQWKATQ
jgi:uncharacterized phage-like protein YoqJ